MSKKIITTEKFIQRAIKVHGNKYDYSNSIYKTTRIKIKIICKKHGVFEQTPINHINNKQECPLCYRKSTFKTLAEFVKEATKIHGCSYDYSKAKYKTTHTATKIICKKHGVFEQTPLNHLQGHGCKKCAKELMGNIYRKSTEQFILDATKVHGKTYDYSLVQYTNKSAKVKIICKKHGVFSQISGVHLQNHGCPKCTSSISKMETAWLDSLKLPKRIKRNYTIRINEKRYNVDAIDCKTKTIYEFNGNFFHGNPKIYDHQKYNPICHKTYGELYNKTIEREKMFKKLGYNVVSIWENDFKKQLK